MHELFCADIVESKAFLGKRGHALGASLDGGLDAKFLVGLKERAMLAGDSGDLVAELSDLILVMDVSEEEGDGDGDSDEDAEDLGDVAGVEVFEEIVHGSQP
jgi:hypothetical protein